MQATIRGVPISAAARMLIRPYRRTVSQVRHVFICLADHYEPFWGSPPRRVALQRVERWIRDYPKSVAGCVDSRGQSPQHTFFYPAEDYDPDIIDRLRTLIDDRLGDVEVHLHHDRDTSQKFCDRIGFFSEALYHKHGLLRRDLEGRVRYAFIHGNWALDNARADGRWCGLNNELSLLVETGCYADMTLPSAPEPGQTRTINSIYYAIDDPQRPKSHDVGVAVKVGQPQPQQGLLMIQGPLAWNWSSRKWGILPRLENGDLHGHNGPTLDRFQAWLRVAPSIDGRPDWVFIKLHTHGAIDVNSALFLDGRAARFHRGLADCASRLGHVRYYYVTAWQMVGLIHQAVHGAVVPDFELADRGWNVSTSSRE